MSDEEDIDVDTLLAGIRGRLEIGSDN